MANPRYNEKVSNQRIAKKDGGRVKNTRARGLQGVAAPDPKKSSDFDNILSDPDLKKYYSGDSDITIVFKNKEKVKKMGGGRITKKDGGSLKKVQPHQKGLKKLPKKVRNKMGYMKKGGKVI